MHVCVSECVSAWVCISDNARLKYFSTMNVLGCVLVCVCVCVCAYVRAYVCMLVFVCVYACGGKCVRHCACARASSKCVVYVSLCLYMHETVSDYNIC